MPPPKKANNKASSTAASPAKTTGSTPLASSVISSSGRKKKETTTRRRAKKHNNSEPPTPTTPLTPTVIGNGTVLKKEHSHVSKLDGIEENPSSKDKSTPSNSLQLTPPVSENISSNNEASSSSDQNNNSNSNYPTGSLINPANDDGSNFMDSHNNDGTFPNEDEIIGGSQMINGGHNNDLYSDFAMSDFSNEISGEGNFNLETFSNTDGAEIDGFDSYWRDGVEATD
jgi:hypothetical protein